MKKLWQFLWRKHTKRVPDPNPHASPKIWETYTEGEKVQWQRYYDGIQKELKSFWVDKIEIQLTDQQIKSIAHNAACMHVWLIQELIATKNLQKYCLK